jgi:hypothetical protein
MVRSGPKFTPHTVIGASGAQYECPTIAAIDRHLVALGARIDACRLPAILELLRDDRDRLLDYRYILMGDPP